MRARSMRSGSMVLTCVFYTSLFMLFMLMQWKSQEALQLIMRARIQRVQQQYALEALMRYGISLCKNQYALIRTTISKRKTPFSLTFERWPLGGDVYMQGKIDINYAKMIKLTAQLMHEGKKHMMLSCNLEKKRVDNTIIYVVTAWKWHAP